MLSSPFILAIIISLLMGSVIVVWLFIRRARRDSSLGVHRQVADNDALTSITDSTLPVYGIQLIDETGCAVPINSLPVLIGCASQNDIILKNETISPVHARIYYEAMLESICIEDCHSQNGILINGQPTCKNVLKDGDKITLGNLVFTFRNVGYHPPTD
jgi:pSer/pThr/pTyr-binding forkhead associated (FHA) protein